MLSDPDGTIRTMGNLYEYFSAPDDEAALRTFAAGPAAVGLQPLDVKTKPSGSSTGSAHAA